MVCLGGWSRYASSAQSAWNLFQATQQWLVMGVCTKWDTYKIGSEVTAAPPSQTWSYHIAKSCKSPQSLHWLKVFYTNAVTGVSIRGHSACWRQDRLTPHAMANCNRSCKNSRFDRFQLQSLPWLRICIKLNIDNIAIQLYFTWLTWVFALIFNFGAARAFTWMGFYINNRQFSWYTNLSMKF